MGTMGRKGRYGVHRVRAFIHYGAAPHRGGVACLQSRSQGPNIWATLTSSWVARSLWGAVIQHDGSCSSLSVRTLEHEPWFYYLPSVISGQFLTSLRFFVLSCHMGVIIKPNCFVPKIEWHNAWNQHEPSLSQSVGLLNGGSYSCDIAMGVSGNGHVWSRAGGGIKILGDLSGWSSGVQVKAEAGFLLSRGPVPEESKPTPAVLSGQEQLG